MTARREELGAGSLVPHMEIRLELRLAGHVEPALGRGTESPTRTWDQAPPDGRVVAGGEGPARVATVDRARRARLPLLPLLPRLARPEWRQAAERGPLRGRAGQPVSQSLGILASASESEPVAASMLARMLQARHPRAGLMHCAIRVGDPAPTVRVGPHPTRAPPGRTRRAVGHASMAGWSCPRHGRQGTVGCPVLGT
jgi:hypothetical protein